MFARSCGRGGVRFASGNVFYMNRTFTARHLQCVSSPLSTGFISAARFSTSAVFASSNGVVSGCSSMVESTKLAEPVGSSRSARAEIMKILGGFDMVPTSVLKDCFVCASQDETRPPAMLFRPHA